MWTAIITVLLTFLLTGLAGNRMVHAWQHRNWLVQQRLIHRQKEHETLQAIFDEVALLASQRQYRMFRLAAAIRDRDVETVRERIKAYDETLVTWNERLNAMMAKLTMHLDYQLTYRLEHDIQPGFVEIGARLEKLAKLKLASSAVSRSELAQVSKSLKGLQGKLSAFIRDVLRFVQDKNSSIYSDGVVTLTRYNLNTFPTWELFKALFKPRIQRNEII